DEAVILSEQEIVHGCHELLNRHSLLGGASAGAAYAAAKRVLTRSGNANTNAIFITPDSGNSYLDTVFSQEWVRQNIA
ncbi:MAG TPA: hypothetical protein VD996_04680, partial [Chitinophagaceae bacterium]|nr:hypothetical protein [Chitinophagaceae bacterium]